MTTNDDIFPPIRADFRDFKALGGFRMMNSGSKRSKTASKRVKTRRNGTPCRHFAAGTRNAPSGSCAACRLRAVFSEVTA